MMAAARLMLGMLALSPAAHAGEGSPVAKVVQMLSDLQGKIIAEGTEAQSTYDEFSEWCEDQSKRLKFEIKTGKSETAELKATIAQEESTSASLSTKIDELAGEISTNEADLKSAVDIRAKENAAFVAEEKELSEVIDTLQRAVGILEREMQKGGASMLQLKNAKNIVDALGVMVQAAAFSTADAQRLTALVQSSQQSDDEELGAPAAAVYKSQSSNIVDTISGLLEKAQGQLDDARKKENAARHNFEMLQQSIQDEIRFGNNDMEASKKGLAESNEKKAGADGDLGVTAKDLTEDTTALAELHRDCMAKASTFEAETKSRAEELDALAKAKGIIQEATAASFLQFGQVSSFRSRDPERFQVVRFVRNLAHKQHSAALAQLASRMASTVGMNMKSGEDPFAKVKGLIADMLEKLEADGEQDASRKAYCDKELAETNEKKAAKTTEIEKLSTQIDQMQARSAKLKEEVAALESSLSALASSQAEMDKLRAKENAAYKASKAETEKGLEGIKLALKVLKDYYAKDDAAHATAEGAGSGIIGLLEVCESDFTKDLSETVSTEESAAATYERETKENEVEKATKEQDVKYKTKESTELDKAAAETKSDRSGVQAELDAVQEYFGKLNTQCVDKAESYEDRTARRAAEIAGLKEALQILDSEAALLIQRSSARRSFLGTVRAH